MFLDVEEKLIIRIQNWQRCWSSRGMEFVTNRIYQFTERSDVQIMSRGVNIVCYIPDVIYWKHTENIFAA